MSAVEYPSLCGYLGCGRDDICGCVRTDEDGRIADICKSHYTCVLVLTRCKGCRDLAAFQNGDRWFDRRCDKCVKRARGDVWRRTHLQFSFY